MINGKGRRNEKMGKYSFWQKMSVLIEKEVL
jgi:hypothetical protein